MRAYTNQITIVQCQQVLNDNANLKYLYLNGKLAWKSSTAVMTILNCQTTISVAAYQALLVCNTRLKKCESFHLSVSVFTFCLADF